MVCFKVINKIIRVESKKKAELTMCWKCSQNGSSHGISSIGRVKHAATIGILHRFPLEFSWSFDTATC